MSLASREPIEATERYNELHEKSVPKQHKRIDVKWLLFAGKDMSSSSG